MRRGKKMKADFYALVGVVLFYLLGSYVFYLAAAELWR